MGVYKLGYYSVKMYSPAFEAHFMTHINIHVDAHITALFAMASAVRNVLNACCNKITILSNMSARH